MSTPGPRLLGPWRRSCQWATTLLVLAVPFVRIDGRGLLRLDLPARTLELAGGVFHIEELYLFLLLCLALALLFLLGTLVLGRVWCGWGCPQTTLSDLAEWWGRTLGLKVTPVGMEGTAGRRVLFQVGCLALALLVGANLTWYFVPPHEFFPRLASGTLAPAPIAFLGIVASTVYLDLVLVRRLLCREFCPYGRFQTALVDPGTLTLRFHPDEARRCIACNACVRACPTGIDIRRGYQVECINCGRCLDACRNVMARRGQKGIIRYTFGVAEKGLRAVFSVRTLLLSTAFLGLTAAFFIGAATRPEASLKLQRSAGALPRLLSDGKAAAFFTAYVTNRSEDELTLSLSARRDGEELDLRGPVRNIPLASGERRRLDFVVLLPNAGGGQADSALFTLTDSADRPLADARASLPSPEEFNDEQAH